MTKLSQLDKAAMIKHLRGLSLLSQKSNAKHSKNIQKQIANIDVPRLVRQLRGSEKTEYDALVEQANEHAGAKLLLNATETVRVQNLEQNIERVSSSLPASASGQPTSASVARAYARLL